MVAAAEFFCKRGRMPKRKSLTSEEQAERFRLAEQKRISGGMLSTKDSDAAIDAMITKNIKDHGP
jgi:hypothetical protein